MGNCFGTHFAEPLPSLPSPPDGIIALNLDTEPSLLKEVVAVMSTSFAGSKTASAEGMLSWCLGQNESVGGDPCNPLINDPSAGRIAAMEFIIKFVLSICLKHGVCVALVKDGKVVGASLMTPPSSRNIHKLGFLAENIISVKLGVLKTLLVEGETEAKQRALTIVMNRAHKDYARTPHWYVYSFAVDNEMQGKGYGRELMEWVSSCADTTGHPVYLETMGPRNVKFYGRNGYEVKEQAPIEYQWKGEAKKCDFHGGITVMVRQPHL